MSGRPPVTLVIPVRDEERSFDALQRSIEAQSYAPAAVIFVDAGSTDRTPDLERAACARRPNWEVLDAGPSSPGRARNVGIAASTTEWVALTDAGIVLDQFWLERLVRYANPTVDVVYGRYEPAPGSWFTDCAALVYVAALTDSPVGPIRDRSVASCLLRREMWKRAGGFPDLRAAEDRIFMRQLESMNARIAVSAEAVVLWHLQPTLRSTFRRFRTYSRVNAQAGEQGSWHYGLRRMYLVGALFVAIARLNDRRWVLVPSAGAVVRAGRGVWRRREGRSIWWVLNPVRLLSTFGITLVIDLATFTGWLEASLPRSRT